MAETIRVSPAAVATGLLVALPPLLAALAEPRGDRVVAQNYNERLFAEQRRHSTPQFWARFGQRPNVSGRTVLDIGCGHGALSIELANQGASAVLGVDTDTSRIRWAQRNLDEHFAHLGERVRFNAQPSISLPAEERFDLVVCKDTLEHVDDVLQLLTDLRQRLTAVGEIWVGFSPLYFSPNGDHNRAGLRVPWAHAVLPKGVVYRSARRVRPNRQPVKALSDIGLNGMTPAQFRSHVESAGLTIAWIEYNRGDKRLLSILRHARHIPMLERYATVSIYAVLTPRVTSSDRAQSAVDPTLTA